MNYHNITKDDMNNGDGLRVVLWVSGCEHCCAECQNPETWDYESGILFNKDAYYEIEEELKKDYVTGLTISGGDPLAPLNVGSVLYIVRRIKQNFPNKTIWIYTGYKYEQLDCSLIGSMILECIDVLIDGKYDKNLRNVELKWRGSSNQRVIDVQRSLENRKVVLYCD